MSNDALGARMKENYEHITRTFLPRRTYTIIRLDGKAFHTYTRGLKRPFDAGLIEDMQLTTLWLCAQIEGTVFAYTQSDEISLLLTDFGNKETQAWFGGNIQKIASVSASIATAEFNNLRNVRNSQLSYQEIEDIGTVHPFLAYFDSRVFTIPDPTEVENYFIWRQADATRNSIQMAAQSVYSHKQLHGKDWSDLNEMLYQKGINFNDYSSHEKRGTLVVKEYFEAPAFDQKKNEHITVNRSRWTNVLETPIFKGHERPLRQMIPRYT